MILKSFKVLSSITFRAFSWVIILVASLKIILPFCLPLTLNDTWVESIVRNYFQDVKIGSVHVVLNDGKLALLLQNVDTPNDASQGIHVTRAYVSPAIFKSVVSRKWIFNKIKLYAGELHFGFGPGHIRIGAIKIPIHPDQPLPIWVHHLNFRHIKVHLDEIPEISEVYLHEVELLNPKHKGHLKAWITEDSSRRASVKLIFDFVKYQDDIRGDLYVKGYDHKLVRLFQLLRWPGADVNGKADFEFWADVDKGRIQSAILDLTGHDLVLSKEYSHLNVDKVNGRLAYDYVNGHHRWQGQDLKLRLGKSHLDAAFLLSSPDFKNYTLTGKNFDIGLIHFIVQDVPQVKSFFQSFDLLPTGNIPYVKMTFEEGNVKPTSVLMEAQNLSFTQKDLSVLGLDGRLHYVKGKITSQLSGEEATISHPGIFAGPLFLSTYDINSVFDLSRAHIALDANATQQGSLLKGGMELFLQSKPIIDFHLHAPKLTVLRVKELLPVKKMKPTLTAWLDKSLLDGNFRDLNFSYQGLVEDFANPANPKPFSLKTKLDQVALDYASNWPDFKKLNGFMSISDHKLEILGEGTFEDATIKQVKAKIDDMRLVPSILKVNADIASNLAYGWDAIHTAHLINLKTFEALKMQAPMDLALNLTIPLAKEEPSIVNGEVTFDQGTLGFKTIPWTVEKLHGKIAFNNKKVESESLMGSIFDHPIDTHLNIELNNQNKLELAIRTDIDLGPITKEVVKGSAPIWATLDWPFDHDQATYSGIVKVNQLAFEGPLDAIEDKPEEIHFGGQIIPEQSLNLEAYWGALGRAMVQFDKAHGLSEPTLAILEVGERSLEKKPTSGWHLLGHIPSFKVDDWLDYAKNFQGKPSGQNIAFNLSFEDLMIKDMYLKDVELIGSRQAQTQRWVVEVNSAKLQGDLDIDLEPNKPWLIFLDHLYLAKKSSKSKASIDLPRRPFKVKIKEFETNFARGKDFNLNLVPNEEGFIIDDFSFETQYSKFDISGIWANRHAPHHVKLAGKIDTKDIHDVLNVFGKPSSVRQAKGQVHFDVAYKGDLNDPDLNTLRGQGEVELKSGHILGVNPGIGRILSLLNLDTLQRRLMFDFSDVTHDGFAFDTLEGRFNLGHGRITTDDLRLEAPAANIDFFGDLDIVSQQVKAQVTVMPNVTGSLPLAAAIAAGNPAVGAAVWLMDKVFGPKIQEMTRYNYLVSGTIDSPNVKEVLDTNRRTMTRR